MKPVGTAKYIEASTVGRLMYSAFLFACSTVYFLPEIFSWVYPMPNDKVARMQAIDVRNFISLLLTASLGACAMGYAMFVGICTLRAMEFPYLSMNLPVRLRVRTVASSSTILLCVLVVLLSVVLQFMISWYTWYKWRDLLATVSS